MKEKPVILIVDDQSQNIDLLEAFLNPQGYEIISSPSGEDAMNKLSRNQVDLVLLDVMMPGMDGFEVTRRIRNISHYKLLPIVLVTALHEKEDRVKGIEAGCDDFISKPLDKIELLARVRALLKVKAYYDLMKDYQKDLEVEVMKRTLELKLAFENIKAATLETIHRLSVASEYRDEKTGTHIKRISAYSVAVARKLGLDNSVIEIILYATPMHDVGKIGIPDGILLKEGKLDPLEWEIMKQHTIIGAEILKNSDSEFIEAGESIALCHHERWDGSGYPNGLKGIEIPMTSRITAIADVFDALTSERCYKKAFGIEESFEIIKKGSGNHFDPDVVKAFFGVRDEIIEIKNSIDKEAKNLNLPDLQILLQQYNDFKIESKPE